MSKDWQAVADAITGRLSELDMTQAELSHRAGVALETVRELHRNLKPRRRNPRTLAAVSNALGWPDNRLALIADGADPDARTSGDPVLARLSEITAALTDVTDRLDAIEQRLADGELRR